MGLGTVDGQCDVKTCVDCGSRWTVERGKDYQEDRRCRKWSASATRTFDSTQSKPKFWGVRRERGCCCVPHTRKKIAKELVAALLPICTSFQFSDPPIHFALQILSHDWSYLNVLTETKHFGTRICVTLSISHTNRKAARPSKRKRRAHGFPSAGEETRITSLPIRHMVWHCRFTNSSPLLDTRLRHASQNVSCYNRRGSFEDAHYFCDCWQQQSALFYGLLPSNITYYRCFFSRIWRAA